jgi:hypothetical protein
MKALGSNYLKKYAAASQFKVWNLRPSGKLCLQKNVDDV